MITICKVEFVFLGMMLGKKDLTTLGPYWKEKA
jgi:hypothetical protein